MNRFPLVAFGALLVPCALFAGCGGGSGGVAVPTATPIASPTPSPSPTPTIPPFNLTVTSLDATNYGFTSFVPANDFRFARREIGTDGTYFLGVVGRVNPNATDKTTTRNLSIGITKASEFVVGDRFIVNNLVTPGATAFSSGEVIPPPGSSSSSTLGYWQCKPLAGVDSGTIEVVGLSAERISLRLNNVRLLPASDGARGTLLFNGIASGVVNNALTR